MEPTASPIKERYVIPTKILRVFERHQIVLVSGYGSDALFEKKGMGWYLTIQGSYEALHVGEEKPSYVSGDEINIIIESRTPCPNTEKSQS